jgi:hypothetical protein
LLRTPFLTNEQIAEMTTAQTKSRIASNRAIIKAQTKFQVEFKELQQTEAKAADYDKAIPISGSVLQTCPRN